jgi:hypothetical protein
LFLEESLETLYFDSLRNLKFPNPLHYFSLKKMWITSNFLLFKDQIYYPENSLKTWTS